MMNLSVVAEKYEIKLIKTVEIYGSASSDYIVFTVGENVPLVGDLEINFAVEHPGFIGIVGELSSVILNSEKNTAYIQVEIIDTANGLTESAVNIGITGDNNKYYSIQRESV
mmetsp:Transcript_2955/g.2550  ORF Transcript_2955/g.2550 Transcript_2955/m.2550 type:complete len:112 (+) Transcript_2955:925-1260(+)